MIEVLVGALHEAGAEVIVRPVSSVMEAMSSASRDVEVRAGEAVATHLARQGDLPAGAAIVTPAGDLPFLAVVHVVVHDDTTDVNEAVVEQAFLNGLRRVAQLGFRSVATPPLGAGVGGLEVESSARAMLSALRSHGASAPLPERVLVLVQNDYEQEVFRRMVESTSGHELVTVDTEVEV